MDATFKLEHRLGQKERDNPNLEFQQVIGGLAEELEQHGFTIDEIDNERNWGGFIRLANNDASRFLEYFFEDTSPDEAYRGVEGAELSPKLLIVKRGDDEARVAEGGHAVHRLSWQYHDRRAERWVFLTPGAYYRSDTDEQGEVVTAVAGEVVQFEPGERHRLVGLNDDVVVVAEIWQHTEPGHLSDEADNHRLADDYGRSSPK